jgi:hypothetical protein
MDAVRALFQAFCILTLKLIRQLRGTEFTFKQYVKDPQAVVLGTKKFLLALKTTRRPKTYGLTSGSSTPTGI